MTFLLDRDQEQRLIQDQCIEEIYIDGIGDAMNGVLPQMAELIYLQGYAEGMREFKKQVRASVVLPIINEDIQEYPLLCGQCAHLINGKCVLKNVVRNSNKYACDRVVIDSPF